ncbi:HNH endonuclease [Geobacillus sp. MMMUD3]|nr:HNH endonuclease [Geobacillus sp. MMMUD3]
MEFPLPIKEKDNPATFQYCRWCGAGLKDKRRRYCSKEHAEKWLVEVLFVEDYQRQRDRAMKRDNFACQRCGMTRREHYEAFNQDLHTHHIVPRSWGGSNYMDNLITLCRNCHVEIHRELGVKIGK